MIHVSGLEKDYGGYKAVKGIDLEIRAGETFALLGPNGAGKTTTISMLSGLLQQTAGTIRINGLDTQRERERVKSEVGIVPQDIALYPELNAYDNLMFFGTIYGLKRKELKEKVRSLLELIGLTDKAKEPIKTYSGGMKRRINIAAALLHDPKVVFMDEPTVGIDPQSRNKVYELIRTLKDRGMTIVYITHYMEEVTSLCDRAAIIDGGEVITVDTIQGLLHRVHGGVLEFTLHTAEAAGQTADLLRTLDCIVETQQENEIVRVIVTDMQTAVSATMERINAEEIQLQNMVVNAPSLQTVFLQLTGSALRD